MTDFFRSSSFSPTIVCALCFVCSYALSAHKWKLPWRFLSLALMVALVTTAAAYLMLPILAEDTETDIAAIAALAMRGEPVYPAPNSAACYMLLYGPLTYLFHIPFYAVFGANLFSFKLLGFLSFVAALIGLYRIARTFAAPGPSLIGCGCAGVVLLRYLPVPFWGRIDSLILGIVALAYWIALRAPVGMVVLSTALATGIITNLKFTGVMYLLPLLGLLWMQRGRLAAITSALLGAALVPLPFLLPNVSFANYLYVIGINGKHGIEPMILLRNLQYTLLLLAPVLLLYFRAAKNEDGAGREKRMYLLLIAASMIVSAVFGGKAGAGSYHLLPYIVPLLHLYFWIRESIPESGADNAFGRIALAWVLSLLIFSASQLHSMADCLRFARRGGRVLSAIAATGYKYRGRGVEVGAGADFLDRRTFYAFVPPLRGGPFTVSNSTIRDMQFGGVAIPERTLRYFAHCDTPVWLIPAGQQPFTAKNTYYEPPRVAFSEAFRSNFASNYRKAATGEQFDTWVCSH